MNLLQKLLILVISSGFFFPMHGMWKNFIARAALNKKAIFTAATSASAGVGYATKNVITHKLDDVRLEVLKQNKFESFRQTFPTCFRTCVVDPLLQRMQCSSSTEGNTNEKSTQQCQKIAKTLCMAGIPQQNILTTDIESLKRIAAHYPEASIIFAQEFAKHIPQEAIITLAESHCMHTMNKESLDTRLCIAAFFESTPASPEHQQLVHNVAQKLQLNSSHALVVFQLSNACKTSLFVHTNNIVEDGDYMMSSIIDKAKHFIPYIHVISLQGNFSNLSSETQKFLIGHELMHAKLGHTLKKLDPKKPHDMLCAREREKECDLGAAALGPEFARGGIQFASTLSRLYGFKIPFILKDPFASHPSAYERMKYLKEFAKQRYSQQ